jgi:toxin ParE1/3/4
MVRLKWLKSAKEDLKEIYNYISFDSKRYAKLKVQRIQNRTEILKKTNCDWQISR